jgi:hypothetical protein
MAPWAAYRCKHADMHTLTLAIAKRMDATISQMGEGHDVVVHAKASDVKYVGTITLQ